MAKPSWITCSPSSGTGGGSVNVTAAANQQGPENPDGTLSRSGSLTVKTTSGITKEVSLSQSAPFSNAIFNNVLTYNVSGGYYTVSANISYKKSDGSTYSNTVFRGGTGTVEVGIPAGTGEVTFTESITGNYETVSKYIRSTFRVYCPQIGLDKTDTGIFSSNSDTLKISGGDISKLIKNTQFSLTITAEDS